MLLTLEVVSPNGEALGPQRRKTVGPEGATIGRAKENDWVILDQYISRVNARIVFMSGAFYIEGLGRNPLAMHDSANTVANNNLQPLHDGDRFFLDQYEIRATISGHTAALGQTAANVAVDDPFANPIMVPNAMVPNARPGNTAGVGFGGVVIGEVGSGAANLDPLSVLGGETQDPEPPRPIDIHGNVLQEPFHVPPITTPGTKAPAGIPSDWLDPHAQPAPRVPPRAEPARRPQDVPPIVIPSTWDDPNYTQLELKKRPPPSPPPQEVPPDPPNPQNTVVDDIGGDLTDPFAVSRGGVRQPPPRLQPPPEPEVQVQPQPPPPQRPRPVPPRVAPTQSTDSLEAQSSLGQLLRSAGLPSAQMTPEIAAEIGEALRIVVQGVMDVLHSRAEIKSELRMSMTRMQSQENNPLKFSPNVEGALHTLLVERNRGYMSTTRAFDEAFNDIRNHQVAVLQGIRVAFANLLQQLHPDTLEQQMENQGKRGGLLNIGSKARFRDYYGELFEKLTQDPEASFRRLFGEPFAQAYESQMEQFAQAANRSKNQSQRSER